MELDQACPFCGISFTNFENNPAEESASVPSVAKEMRSLFSCTAPNGRRRVGSEPSVRDCGSTFRGIEAWSGAEVPAHSCSGDPEQGGKACKASERTTPHV